MLMFQPLSSSPSTQQSCESSYIVVMEPAGLTPATETRMLTRKKLMKAPFNDSQSQVAEKALRLDNKNI